MSAIQKTWEALSYDDVVSLVLKDLPEEKVFILRDIEEAWVLFYGRVTESGFGDSKLVMGKSRMWGNFICRNWNQMETSQVSGSTKIMILLTHKEHWEPLPQCCSDHWLRWIRHFWGCLTQDHREEFAHLLQQPLRQQSGKIWREPLSWWRNEKLRIILRRSYMI